MGTEPKPRIPASVGDTVSVRQRLSIFLVVSASVLVGCAVLVVADREIGAFETLHAEILDIEVRETATAVEDFLDSRRRLVATFALEKRELLESYAENVNEDARRAEISESLSRWFPEYFTFTIADAHGRDLVDDLEGLVGNVCQINIRDFVRSIHSAPEDQTVYRPFIHPQPYNYHFDIMVPRVGKHGPKGVFFVSFYPETLKRILASHQSPGHFLMLVHKTRENLIEVSAEGARDVLSTRRSITLSQEEIENVRATRDVAGSLWRVVGYLQPGVVDDFKRKSWITVAALLACIAGATALSVLFIVKTERRRRWAFDELHRTVDTLEISRESLSQQAQDGDCG